VHHDYLDLTIHWQLTRYKTSYDLENDKFHGDGGFFGMFAPHGVLLFLIIPCFLLALVINEGFTPFEVLWTSRVDSGTQNFADNRA
jgi:hypothetical protein